MNPFDYTLFVLLGAIACDAVKLVWDSKNDFRQDTEALREKVLKHVARKTNEDPKLLDLQSFGMDEEKPEVFYFVYETKEPKFYLGILQKAQQMLRKLKNKINSANSKPKSKDQQKKVKTNLVVDSADTYDEISKIVMKAACKLNPPLTPRILSSGQELLVPEVRINRELAVFGIAISLSAVGIALCFVFPPAAIPFIVVALILWFYLWLIT